jgi:hypothetical protein
MVFPLWFKCRYGFGVGKGIACIALIARADSLVLIV